MKVLNLTDAHHIALDQFAESKATIEAREARFLAAAFVDLGGKLNEPWRYDKNARCFFLVEPETPKPDGDHPSGKP